MDNKCNFLQGVCVLQNVIETYLNTGDFYEPELAEMLKQSGGVKVIPFDAQADETAKTVITMRRDNIVLAPKQSLNFSSNTSGYKPQVSLRLIISSQAYYLTEKLGIELLQFIGSISNMMSPYHINIGSLTLTETQNNTETSPNYFVNQLVIACAIPQLMWKRQVSDDILSTMKLNIKFDGQDILSV